MKLYDIPRESKIKVECFDAQDKKIGDFITFHHLDGMYSFCTVDGVTDDKYNIVHLSASTPLKKVGDYYEIDAEETHDPVSQDKARKPKKVPVTYRGKPVTGRNDTDRQARKQA